MKGITRITACFAAGVLLLGLSSSLAQVGSSAQVRNRQAVVDANGDGICDITGQKVGTGAGTRQGQVVQRGKQNGPGDGTGNQGTGPRDGTGYGAKSSKRLGPQDGSHARIGSGTGIGAGGSRRGAGSPGGRRR